MAAGRRIQVKAATKSKVSKALNRRFGELWRDAVREFVFVLTKEFSSQATNPDKPYIDTGMSIASLIPLASHSDQGFRIGLGQFVKDSVRVNKALAVQASPTQVNGSPRGVPKAGKSAAEGVRQGQDSFDLTFGSPDAPDYLFSFRLVVEQTILHLDFFGPAVRKARAAFLRYMKANLKNYLKASDIKNILTGRG
jgi:hypothetical protein